MSTLQNEVIKLLTENARYTSEQMANVLGVTASEIEDIVAELEKDGVIVKYSAIINSEAIEDEKVVEALIEVKVAPQKLKGFDSYAEEIYSFKEVKSLYLMSGGFDLAVFVEGKNLGDVASFVSEKLSVIDGIASVQTHFILKKYKIEGQVTSASEESKRQIIGA